MKDHDAFWLFDQKVAKGKPVHRLLQIERVDDAVDSPGLYVAKCNCGTEVGPKSQRLIHDEFTAHLKEAG